MLVFRYAMNAERLSYTTTTTTITTTTTNTTTTDVYSATSLGICKRSSELGDGKGQQPKHHRCCALRSAQCARSGARRHQYSVVLFSGSVLWGAHIVSRESEFRAGLQSPMDAKGQCIRHISFLWGLVSEIESPVFIGAL